MTILRKTLDTIARGNDTALGADEVKAVRGTVITIAVIVTLFLGFTSYLGVMLVSTGDAGGPTVIKFLGTEIRTSSAGVAVIAVSVISLVMILRRLFGVLLKALD